MTEVDAATERELLDAGGGADDSGPMNEDELLGGKTSPPENGSDVKVIKKENDDDDLFDEAIAPLNTTFDKNSTENKAKLSVSATSTTSQGSERSIPGRFSCYVGNMTWWTTDADLAVNIASLGVSDILEIKFFENRINGQSKGFALCVFGSDLSLRLVTEKMGNRLIHGQAPAVFPHNKQSLSRLEEAAAKTQTRADPKVAKKTDENFVNMGTIRIGSQPLIGQMNRVTQQHTRQPLGMPAMNQPPVSLIMNGQQMQVQNTLMRSIVPTVNAPSMGAVGGVSMSLPPGAPRPVIPGQPSIVGQQPMMPTMSMGNVQFQPQPLMQTHVRPPMGMPPPGAHVNPQVFPGIQQNPTISDAEFEEIMSRNRTVSSSAISRAVADAAAGDVKSAVETLLTAMSLLKQSRVGNDSRCIMLINNLQDTLNGIESKAYSSGSSRRSGRDRSRSRSRDRDRKRRRRSHTRSRSRSRSPARHRSSRHY